MKFVIMNDGIIPGVGVKGPVLSPRTYDIHQVLRWISVGVDVREVMEDGTFRKLHFNDERLIQELGDKLDNKRQEKNEIKKEVEKLKVEKRIHEEKSKKKKVQFVPIMDEENKKIEPAKKESKVEEKKLELPVDNLEKPE